MNLESVPVRILVDTSYINSMFMTDLVNIIDPQIEQVDVVKYQERINYVLYESGMQVINHLEFDDPTFYRHMLGLPEMSLMQHIVSLRIPERRQAFINSFRSWALSFRHIVLATINPECGVYSYVMDAITPRYVVVSKYYAPPANTDGWHDVLAQTDSVGYYYDN